MERSHIAAWGKLVGPVAAAIGVGVAVGLFLPQDGIRGVLMKALSVEEEKAEEPDPHAGHDHLEDDPENVVITASAAKNLGLSADRLQLKDHFRTLRMAAEIVEMPGYSNRAVSTTVNGIVTKIFAVPGQAVNVGDKLFELKLTGEALATAQAQLLDSVARIAATDIEIKRLEPIASSGTAAKQISQLRSERNRLDVQRQVRMQELLVRGLSEAQIQSIVENRKLVRSMVITVPDDPMENRPTAEGSPTFEWEYTIEELTVFPGKAVKPGDDLCHIAHHTALYIKGHAFPGEIEQLGKVDRNGWHVRAEFGTEGNEYYRNGLSIQYIDNHTDSETQTVGFYLPLVNEVLQDTQGKAGRLFRSWRFKPGQRGHLLIPVEQFREEMVLPREAVVREGPQTFVFRRIARRNLPTSNTTPDPDAPEPYDIYRRIPVHVRFQDAEATVISADEKLRPGNVIAMNNAYQLQLALKSKGGDDGGHHHHHH